MGSHFIKRCIRTYFCNLHNDDFNKQLTSIFKVVKLADETILFCIDKNILIAPKKILKKLQFFINFFSDTLIHPNAKHAELIIFSRKNDGKYERKNSIVVDKYII